MTDLFMIGLAPLPGSEAGALAEALRLCETIASRNRSHLYRVSQLLRDRRRYEAFLATHAVMRVIDDFVDAVPDVTNLTPEDRSYLEQALEQWRDRIEAAASASPGPEPLDVALAAALASFPVPLSLWETFLEAMRYDLRRDRFETWESFQEYAEGAAAAPTAIFVFLLCAQPGTGESAPPVRFGVPEVGDGFDYLACGRELGFFAYLAHVLRDVRKDLLKGARGRIYLPASELAKAGLSEEEFRRLVSSG
ncbi:MAG: squalene/phytoene synthase family protein, partial [Candidatus Coatesbacteria bacterium]